MIDHLKLEPAEVGPADRVGSQVGRRTAGRGQLGLGKLRAGAGCWRGQWDGGDAAAAARGVVQPPGKRFLGAEPATSLSL